MDDEIKAQLVDLGFFVASAVATALVGILAQLARKANAYLDQKLQATEFARCERLAGNALDDLQRQSLSKLPANAHEAKALAAQRIWGQVAPRKRSLFRPRNRDEKLKLMVEEAVEQATRHHLARNAGATNEGSFAQKEDSDVQS